LPTQKKYFDGKELRDAVHPLVFPVLSVDLTKAKAIKSKSVDSQENFAACVLAQGCIRTFGEDAKVRVMRRTAWVSLPGERYAQRYDVYKQERGIIAGFDKDEDIHVGVFVQLNPPARGRQLKHMRETAKQWRAKNKTRVPATGTLGKRPDPLRGVVRNGTFVRL
jgi:hypothetical protein